MQTAIAEAADGYSIPSGTTQTINEHGICRRVTNAIAGGHGLFVPTRSLMEWASNPVSFLSNTIPGVSLAACIEAMSVRFRSVSNAHLTRVIPTTSNRTTWTWSGWVKRGSKIGTIGEDIYCAKLTGASYPSMCLSFIDSDRMRIWSYTGSAFLVNKYTVRSFRDPAAWYHVVLTVDTNDATAENRVRLYINGQRETGFSTNTNPSQFANLDLNVAGYNNTIGGYGAGSTGYFDGYMADVTFIDGQALEPTAFAENDEATGQWVPKAYAGTYGTNGFRLDFGNIAALGADSSGNNNNWTPNNISTASGVSHDAMGDASRPVSAQGNGFGNFATLNPLSGLTNPTFSEGNLAVTFPTGVTARAMATQAVDVSDPAGYYWEHTLSTNAAIHGNGGFITEAASTLFNSYYSDGSYAFSADGSFYGNGALVMGGLASVTTNDTVGFGIRSGNVYLYKNGVVMNNGNPVLTGLTGRVFPALWRASSTGAPSFYFNTGQRPFHAGLPAGFKTLNTHSLPTPAVVTPSAFFKTVTYTGNGSFQQIGTPPALTGGASIAHSARFRAESSAYMTRAPGAGNRRIWTWSGWVKRVGVDAVHSIFSAGSSGGGDFLYFNSDNTLRWYASGTDYKITSRRFRDEGQWSHLVLAVNTTNATAADRYRLFVDGRRVTTFSTDANPSLNFDSNVNNTVPHDLGRYTFQGCCTLNGYLADVHFVDGQALDASSFGQFNSAGVWVPNTYAGSYGTNGYRLNFGNSAALGADSSGNGNNWTVNNIAATDQMADTPTTNAATMNPLDKSSGIVLSEGNLRVVANTPDTTVRATLSPNAGKWYFETLVTSAGTRGKIGMALLQAPVSSLTSCGANEYTFLFWTGQKCGAGGSNVAYGLAVTTGDVVQTAVDLDNGRIWWGKNGTWFASGDPASGANPAFTGLSGKMAPYFFENAGSSFTQVSFNFGQRPFAHTPPAGFAALNTANIATTDFVPDLAIIKSRSAATDWAWYDRERGATLDIGSNLTSAETVESGGLLGFNAGGFNVGNLAKVNTSGANYIAYLFKKGATPGFDIVTYTGTGANRTINHGLGTAPAFVVTKNRGGTANWGVWHQRLTSAANFLLLNWTGAKASDATYWNSTPPGESSFSVGSNVATNANGVQYVSYLFSEVPGFSKFGRYTGNGSADGPFVHTGFKPAFLLIKRLDAVSGWMLFDNTRSPYNAHAYPLLSPHLPDIEVAPHAAHGADFLSNGFKFRTTDAWHNASGGSYIYAAFAESPFKYSNAR